MATASKVQTRPGTTSGKTASPANPATQTGRTSSTVQSAPVQQPKQDIKLDGTIEIKKSQEIVPLDDELAALLEQSKGGGFEEATVDAFATPFLVILQDLSPQTEKLMPGYIEGAKPVRFFKVSHKSCLKESKSYRATSHESSSNGFLGRRAADLRAFILPIHRLYNRSYGMRRISLCCPMGIRWRILAGITCCSSILPVNISSVLSP